MWVGFGRELLLPEYVDVPARSRRCAVLLRYVIEDCIRMLVLTVDGLLYFSVSSARDAWLFNFISMIYHVTWRPWFIITTGLRMHEAHIPRWCTIESLLVSKLAKPKRQRPLTLMKHDTELEANSMHVLHSDALEVRWRHSHFPHSIRWIAHTVGAQTAYPTACSNVGASTFLP